VHAVHSVFVMQESQSAIQAEHCVLSQKNSSAHVTQSVASVHVLQFSMQDVQVIIAASQKNVELHVVQVVPSVHTAQLARQGSHVDVPVLGHVPGSQSG